MSRKDSFIKKAREVSNQLRQIKKPIHASVSRLGFKVCKRSNAMCCSRIWINKKLGVVVKPRPIICDPHLSSKYIVPRHTFQKDYQEFWIQPLVNRKDNIKAYRFFQKEHPDWVDLHAGNVGHWAGRPAIFDW